MQHPVDPEQLYLAHRLFIDRTAGTICQRHHVPMADRGDFVSIVHLHLVSEDYRVLRVFEGRAPIEVFLLAVIRQKFQDWRNTQWGRWRPSEAARRLGPVAVLLETFWVRDGLDLNQVIEMMRTNHGVTDTPASLHALAAQLPIRPRRAFVPASEVDERLSTPSGEESHILSVEADRVAAALDDALAQIPAGDRLLLRLRFDDDVPIVALARLRSEDYQTTYRRLARVLGDVRRSLEASGISAFDAAQVLAHRGLALREEKTP